MRRSAITKLVFALFLLTAHVIQSFAASEHQPLPKIRIARHGRTFVTEDGKPFVPFGVNYYRPGTGWAPQIWKTFDAEATRHDFERMHSMGVNCVRVFLTFHSFYTDPGVLRDEGLKKFDEFLKIAEDNHIYVHPTGPEHWEGPPNWRPVAIGNEKTLQALESFWKLFAARYRGRNVIFAYDLKNEPRVPWNNDVLIPRWNDWLKAKYRTTKKLHAAWHADQPLEFGQIPPPPQKDALNDRRLLDFQLFREDIAEEWTRRQVAAIKSVDSDALTTIGFLQTTVPTRCWEDIGDYTAFRPKRQAKYLDFLEIHFYPSERYGYEYRKEDDELANLSYLEGIVREVAKPGKPVVMAEFGWYGGKEKPKFDRGVHPIGTEEQQAKYLRRVIEVSKGLVVGWLNWGLYDHPGATDCSELTGLITVGGQTKAWGKTFEILAHQLENTRIAPVKIGARPEFDWTAAITSTASENSFRVNYFKAFLQDKRRFE